MKSLSALLAATVALPSVIVRSSVTAAPTTGTTSASPAEVLNNIHETDQLEVKIGELAKRKATSKKIRNYGDRLARDHRTAEKMVTRTARAKNIPLSSDGLAPGSDKAATLNKLEGLSGAEFDREFLATMEKGHEEAISMLNSSKDSLQDKNVRTLVVKLIPILEQHHTLALDLERTEP